MRMGKGAEGEGAALRVRIGHEEFDIYSQVLKALANQPPFKDEAPERLQPVPVSAPASSRGAGGSTDRKRKSRAKKLQAGKKGGKQGAVEAPPQSFWTHVEDYFRTVTTEDMQVLMPGPRLQDDAAFLVPRVERHYSIAWRDADEALQQPQPQTLSDVRVKRKLLTAVAKSKKKVLLLTEAACKPQSEPARITSVLSPPEDDREDVCHVCFEGDSDDSNHIVYCEKCSVAVHQACYGIPRIPPENEPWLCDACRALDTQIGCVLCPVQGGALKAVEEDSLPAEKESGGAPADPKQYAHLVCAQWIPETYISEEDRCVQNVSGILKDRWKLLCCMCKEKRGVCIQCSHGLCATAFHPLCARDGRLRMEMSSLEDTDEVELRAYCPKHSLMRAAKSSAQPRNGESANQVTAPMLASTGTVPIAEERPRDLSRSFAEVAAVASVNEAGDRMLEATGAELPSAPEVFDGSRPASGRSEASGAVAMLTGVDDGVVEGEGSLVTEPVPSNGAVVELNTAAPSPDIADASLEVEAAGLQARAAGATGRREDAGPQSEAAGRGDAGQVGPQDPGEGVEGWVPTAEEEEIRELLEGYESERLIPLVKGVMRTNNVTQTAFARRSGVSQGMLSTWLQGRNRPSQPSLNKRLRSYIVQFCQVAGGGDSSPRLVVPRPPSTRALISLGVQGEAAPLPEHDLTGIDTEGSGADGGLAGANGGPAGDQPGGDGVSGEDGDVGAGAGQDQERRERGMSGDASTSGARPGPNASHRSFRSLSRLAGERSRSSSPQSLGFGGEGPLTDSVEILPPGGPQGVDSPLVLGSGYLASSLEGEAGLPRPDIGGATDLMGVEETPQPPSARGRATRGRPRSQDAGVGTAAEVQCRGRDLVVMLDHSDVVSIEQPQEAAAVVPPTSGADSPQSTPGRRGRPALPVHMRRPPSAATPRRREAKGAAGSGPVLVGASQQQQADGQAGPGHVDGLEEKTRAVQSDGGSRVAPVAPNRGGATEGAQMSSGDLRVTAGDGPLEEGRRDNEKHGDRQALKKKAIDVNGTGSDQSGHQLGASGAGQAPVSVDIVGNEVLGSRGKAKPRPGSASSRKRKTKGAAGRRAHANGDVQPSTSRRKGRGQGGHANRKDEGATPTSGHFWESPMGGLVGQKKRSGGAVRALEDAALFLVRGSLGNADLLAEPGPSSLSALTGLQTDPRSARVVRSKVDGGVRHPYMGCQFAAHAAKGQSAAPGTSFGTRTLEEANAEALEVEFSPRTLGVEQADVGEGGRGDTVGRPAGAGLSRFAADLIVPKREPEESAGEIELAQRGASGREGREDGEGEEKEELPPQEPKDGGMVGDGEGMISAADEESLEWQQRQLQLAAPLLLECPSLVPEDEVVGELLALQTQLLLSIQANRVRCERLLQHMLPRLHEQHRAAWQRELDRRAVEDYLALQREAKRLGRKEKREKEAAAALAAATAAAAASPRVSVRFDGASPLGAAAQPLTGPKPGSTVSKPPPGLPKPPRPHPTALEPACGAGDEVGGSAAEGPSPWLGGPKPQRKGEGDDRVQSMEGARPKAWSGGEAEGPQQVAPRMDAGQVPREQDLATTSAKLSKLLRKLKRRKNKDGVPAKRGRPPKNSRLDAATARAGLAAQLAGPVPRGPGRPPGGGRAAAAAAAASGGPGATAPAAAGAAAGGASRGQLASGGGVRSAPVPPPAWEVPRAMFDRWGGAREDESEAICVICFSGSWVDMNRIVLCDLCGVAVHQECYGIQEIPDGDWLCQPCLHRRARDGAAAQPLKPLEAPGSWRGAPGVLCCICPGSMGAFKCAHGPSGTASPAWGGVGTLRWVHVFCAQWTAELAVGREQHETVSGFETIAPERLTARCALCDKSHGTCLTCNFGHCTVTFHASCARNAALYMSVKAAPSNRLIFRAYCEKHSPAQREKAEAKIRGTPEDLTALKRLRMRFERMRLILERVVKRERIKQELVRMSRKLYLTQMAVATDPRASRTPLRLLRTSSGRLTTTPIPTADATAVGASSAAAAAAGVQVAVGGGATGEGRGGKAPRKKQRGQGRQPKRKSAVGREAVRPSAREDVSPSARDVEALEEAGPGAREGEGMVGEVRPCGAMGQYRPPPTAPRSGLAGSKKRKGREETELGQQSEVSLVGPSSEERGGELQTQQGKKTKKKKKKAPGRVDREREMTQTEAMMQNSRLPKGYAYVPISTFVHKAGHLPACEEPGHERV